MTQEEKAKVYDEALERASKLRFQNPFDTVSQMMEHIFPELKEPEDERIRKWLIDTIKSVPNDSIEWDVIDKSDVLAWLENQGKSMWTEEDEKRLQSCISELQGKGLMGGVDTIDTKWLKALKQRINDNFEKTCKNDSLLDLLNKMPSCITVDGIDYHFVMAKHSYYIAYYKGNREEYSGNAIFGVTSFSPIDLLNEMLEKLKEEGLLK